MNNNSLPPQAPGLKLGDFYYVFFRQKWKIIVILGLGVLVAAAVPFLTPSLYQSEAKLLLKYVLESKSPGQFSSSESQIKAMPETSESIINTELEILTSMDLAKQVAQTVTPERILGKAAVGTNAGPEALDNAAAVIRSPSNLEAEAPKRSSVIRIVFQHRDPAVAQEVVKDLIQDYIKMHAMIHREGGFDEFLTKERDRYKADLGTTEEQLRSEKNKLGISSVDDAKQDYGQQTSRIREKLYDAEAELAEQQAALEKMSEFLAGKLSSTTNQSTATNVAAAVAEATVPPDKIAEYRRVSGFLETLNKHEQDLLLQFKPTFPMVAQIRQQIAETEKNRKQLEEDNPGLLAVKMSEPRSSNAATDQSPVTRFDLAAAATKVASLQSKIQTLKRQGLAIQEKMNALSDKESLLTELQRTRDIQEKNFKNFQESLEQSNVEKNFGAGKVSNISIIEQPSPPSRAASKLFKTMATVLLGSIALAFGLAFVVEFYFDQSLKRPAEIEARIGVPMFLSIPRMSLNGKTAGLNAGTKVPLLPQTAGEQGGQRTSGGASTPGPAEGSAAEKEPAQNGNQSKTPPWDPKHLIRPFSEALRDRLISFFEAKNLTHKPKLVAITSCEDGSGVSTVASSLAASLSETGDGNVLLVNMNQHSGSARYFSKGNLTCALDDALEPEKREQALVQKNLYVVSEAVHASALSSLLPKRFKGLVPRLKASDYDYIIFDMPPVSQISMTTRLARFMDMVLMVVESERTDREVVKKASDLLAESKANLGIVLNKSRTYVPKRLRQELS